MNPTCDVLEQRIAAIEGGVGALAVASGQAASAFAIQNIAKAGDNVVSSTNLYGGRTEEHTSELQSLMRISYAVFCLKKKTKKITSTQHTYVNHNIEKYNKRNSTYTNNADMNAIHEK